MHTKSCCSGNRFQLGLRLRSCWCWDAMATWNNERCSQNMQQQRAKLFGVKANNNAQNTQINRAMTKSEQEFDMDFS